MTYQARQTAPDGCGGIVEGWVDLWPVWAQLRPLAAGRMEKAGALRHEITHEVTVRFRPEIEAGGRFAMPGRILEIVTVRDADETRRHQLCSCVERQ